MYVSALLVLKPFAHRTKKRDTPYKPELPQNHGTRQAIEQPKETEIKRGKNQARPSVGINLLYS